MKKINIGDIISSKDIFNLPYTSIYVSVNRGEGNSFEMIPKHVFRKVDFGDFKVTHLNPNWPDAIHITSTASLNPTPHDHK